MRQVHRCKCKRTSITRHRFPFVQIGDFYLSINATDLILFFSCLHAKLCLNCKMKIFPNCPNWCTCSRMHSSGVRARNAFSFRFYKVCIDVGALHCNARVGLCSWQTNCSSPRFEHHFDDSFSTIWSSLHLNTLLELIMSVNCDVFKPKPNQHHLCALRLKTFAWLVKNLECKL